MTTSTPHDKTQTGLAGEYHVLAQLAERGISGALTLGTHKSVDIMAHNPATGRMLRIEVKTTRKPPCREKIFGENEAFVWIMSKAQESLVDRDLVYCFVYLSGEGRPPRIFVVPASVVGPYLAQQHAQYRLAAGLTGLDSNPMRKFRIRLDDPDHFENAFAILS